MREDISGLKATVDAIAKGQALGVERRAAMQRRADSIYALLDAHDRDLDRRWLLAFRLLTSGLGSKRLDAAHDVSPPSWNPDD